MGDARPSRPPSFRRAIGKRIVKVEQEYVPAAATDGRSAFWQVSVIVLEDGTRMHPVTREGDGFYGVDFVFSKKKGGA